MKILVQVDKTITWLPDGSVALLNVFQWRERARKRGVHANLRENKQE